MNGDLAGFLHIFLFELMGAEWIDSWRFLFLLDELIGYFSSVIDGGEIFGSGWLPILKCWWGAVVVFHGKILFMCPE